MIEIRNLGRDGIGRYDAQSRQLVPSILHIANARLRRLAPAGEATSSECSKLTHNSEPLDPEQRSVDVVGDEDLTRTLATALFVDHDNVLCGSTAGSLVVGGKRYP